MENDIFSIRVSNKYLYKPQSLNRYNKSELIQCTEIFLKNEELLHKKEGFEFES